MKAKEYINIGLIGISVAVLGFCMYTYKNPSIEVGSVDGKTYDSESNYLESILSESGASSVNFISSKYSSGKEEVTLRLNKNGSNKEVTVIVEDNTTPKFTKSVESIKLKVNKGEEKDILKKFKASDASDNLEYFITGDIDFKKTGKYSIEVCCSDANGNTVTTPVEVNIVK